MSIADNIKRIREAHGMNQSEFGKIAGVSDKAVSTWENGLKIPRMGAVQKISDYFCIPKSEILDDKNPAPRIEGGLNRNIIKIAGRDGSFVERELTDDQVALMKNMLDQLKPIDDENL